MNFQLNTQKQLLKQTVDNDVVPHSYLKSLSFYLQSLQSTYITHQPKNDFAMLFPSFPLGCKPWFVVPSFVFYLLLFGYPVIWNVR